MSGKRLLVLNTEVSGMNKYLFEGLRKRGWQLHVHNVPYPRRFHWLAALKSFHPSVSEWRKRFDWHLWRLYKSSGCFMTRSRWCQKVLEKEKSMVDVVLNISGMHAPCVEYDKLKGMKYFVLCSYTMSLSKKWDAWMPYEHEYPKWVELEKALYRNAEKVLTTNDNVRLSLLEDYGVSLSKSLKIGYGLTFDNFPEFNKKYDRKTVLYVGFDFHRKGGAYLLKAFKTVRQKMPDAQLVIIGPSKKSYDIKQEGVTFLGPLRDRDQVQKCFKDASIFVMPSICEPFGLTFLEAMAYKLPCIGTKVDAMGEIIRENETGVLVTPRDPDSLAQAIVSLLDDEREMERMGSAGHEVVRKYYQWDMVVDRLEKVLTTR